MRHKTIYSCSQILEQAGLPVLERARKLSRLEKAVRQLLPAELAAHCKVLNLKNEILVLATPSPAWSGRLRFASADLMQQLQRRYALEIRQVELKVQPEAVESEAVIPSPPTLSLRSATLLAQTATSLSHPPLQEALLRLAAKTREI